MSPETDKSLSVQAPTTRAGYPAAAKSEDSAALLAAEKSAEY
jgi:hypothetical protein